MLSTTPKNSRDKRVHLVFFTDASQTKSTSVSVRNLVLGTVALIGLFAAAVFCVVLYTSNRALVSSKDEYIRELKSVITAMAVTEGKTNDSISNEAQSHSEQMNSVAQEIQNPPPDAMKNSTVDSENTLASLQSSLSSLSTVSANLAKNDAQNSVSGVNFAKGVSAPTKQDELISNNKKSMNAKGSGATVKAGQPRALANTLTGVQVESRHATELNGQTTVHFQLVNTSKSLGQTWAGRVCGVAELNATDPSIESTAGGLISVPGGKPVRSAENPNNYCAEGEFVRFSRLRPTELVVPVKQDSIKRVTIFFVESGSKKTMSQQIEL
ncbi:MAG: hypothetical protein RIR26_506 [Pseudomonadota bacterium]